MMAICITGMHHSGAPMVARTLQLLGLDVHDEADAAGGDREPEGLAFSELNEKILHELGGAWDAPVRLPSDWRDQDRFADLRERGRRVVDAYGPAAVWGWSDPRTCLTMPFWQDLVPDLTAVICVRHPLEVALLLQARARLSWSESIALWQTYNERVLETAEPGRRVITSYARYFTDPDSEVRRLSALLGLTPEPAALDRAVESINPARRPMRSTISDLADAGVGRHVLELYEYLLDLSGDEAAPAPARETRADEHRDEGEGADIAPVAPPPPDLQQLLAQQDELLRLARDLRDQIDRRGDELQSTVYELHALQAGLRSRPSGESERAYLRNLERFRQLVHAEVPHDATVLVVSKGDDELLKLYGRRAWHFPRTDGGEYAGFHPASSAAAVAHLEAMRALGADHLVVPASDLWWLDHYAELRAHLDARYQLVHRADDVGCIYSLRQRPRGALVVERETMERLVSEFRMLFDRDPVLLDWGSGRDLGDLVNQLRAVVSSADATVSNRLPHPDSDVDIVVLASGDAARLAEARRVAAAAVVSFPDSERTTTAGPPEIVWLGAAAASLPSVSIVVPCTGGVEQARVCLGALRWTLPQAAWCEVVAVDDASNDGTDRYLAQVAEADPRIRVVRTPRRMGSLASVNHGAASSTGSVVVTVASDTILLPGWLPPLLRVLRANPDAGAVGGKLLHLDGRIREAGRAVFADGTAAGVGDLEPDPSTPAYNVMREADSCSAALLATPRALFDELRGFDEAYVSDGYGDTDYCFRVRARGYRILYQPASAVVRAGAARAADEDRGQALDHQLFVSRWSRDLRMRAPRQEGPDR